MFGTANQLLAAVALTVATTAIINAGKVRYAWVTLLPLIFVAVTTLSACWLNITDNFWPMTFSPATEIQGYINSLLTVVIMLCAIVILVEAFRRWYKVLVRKEFVVGGEIRYAADGKFSPPDFGCC